MTKRADLEFERDAYREQAILASAQRDGAWRVVAWMIRDLDMVIAALTNGYARETLQAVRAHYVAPEVNGAWFDQLPTPEDAVPDDAA